MGNNYTNIEQSNYMSDSLKEVSKSTGISIDSITYALKILGLYLAKATKASGELIFDATKFSARLISLTYNINEIEIKKHVMEREIGTEVIKFALKNPHIVKEFNEQIQSMFTEYNDMERQSFDYAEERQKQLSVVINKIDDKLARLDAFLKDSEQRLKESKDKLRVHLIEDQRFESKFDSSLYEAKKETKQQYKAPEYSVPTTSTIQETKEEIEEITSDYSPTVETAAETITGEPKVVVSMADSILNEEVNEEASEVHVYSTPPYEVPEYVPDAAHPESKSESDTINEEDKTPSLASINQSYIALEEIKSQNETLKSSIAEKINNYKEQNNNPEISDDDAINAMLEDDPDLRNLVDEQAQTELKLQELLVTTQ
ncbi:MAG: hypothetical protein HQK91_13505 [Nitrospirae bacterium]|nr:hypothetical protein [Nitrospirota bacterium]MBF0542454.1 hypothetical protein [Nitrospirota bacterium]